MKLILNDGRTIEVNKYNCGYQYSENGYYFRIWDIDMLDVLENTDGFIVLGKYGTIEDEDCDEMIPVRNVMSVKELDKWEKPIKSAVTWNSNSPFYPAYYQ